MPRPAWRKEKINEVTQQFIHSLQQGTKIWSERTTTSPSNMHLRYYKSLITNHVYTHRSDEDSNKQQSDHYQAALLFFRVQLLNYATKWGYSFKFWQKVVTRMIMKEPENFKIHQLRVIHLYEADYSILLGLHWQATLYHAEDKYLNNDGTYRSQPNCSAIIPFFFRKTNAGHHQSNTKPINYI